MGKIQCKTDTAIVAKFKNDLSAFCVGSNQDFSWAATSLCTSSLGIFALLRLDLTPGIFDDSFSFNHRFRRVSESNESSMAGSRIRIQDPADNGNIEPCRRVSHTSELKLADIGDQIWRFTY